MWPSTSVTRQCNNINIFFSSFSNSCMSCRFVIVLILLRLSISFITSLPELKLWHKIFLCISISQMNVSISTCVFSPVSVCNEKRHLVTLTLEVSLIFPLGELKRKWGEAGSEAQEENHKRCFSGYAWLLCDCSRSWCEGFRFSLRSTDTHISEFIRGLLKSDRWICITTVGTWSWACIQNALKHPQRHSGSGDTLTCASVVSEQ